MVYFSRQAKFDLDTIFIGLLTWKKHQLTIEHADKYIDDIAEIAYSLELYQFHIECLYSNHKQFGTYFIRYKRNKKTTWYIIYNIDSEKNILIEKIISNYLTDC